MSMYFSKNSFRHIISLQYLASKQNSDLTIFLILAAIVFYIQSLAWPLFPGRDLPSYLLYYNDMWIEIPRFHFLMALRSPLAPLFIGILNDIGGPALIELILGIGFCATILTTYYIGSHWDRIIGLFAALLLLFFPTYGSLFHQVSSDSLFAFTFMLWVGYVFYTARYPTVSKFAWHGLFIFLLILIRPANQILLLFIGCPFLLEMRLRDKIKGVFALLLVCIPLLQIWSAYNYIRYDDFTVSRGFSALILLRPFFFQKIVSADNGPNSADLIAKIKTYLLRNRISHTILILTHS